MREFYVYKLTDHNHIPFYIGKGMKDGKYHRVLFHKHHWNHNKNRKLKNKIHKLGGIFNTEFVLITSDEKKCLELEVRLIREIGLKNLCNLTTGGEGICGYKHTPKTKKLMSKLSSDPRRIKIATHNLKHAIRRNVGKRKLSHSHNQIQELYKTKTTLEISRILHCDLDQLLRYLKEQGWYIPYKNKKLSQKHKEKLAAITKRRMQSALRPISQLTKKDEFLRSFSGSPEACIFLGKSPKRCSEITNVCHGNRKTAFGYKWSFV